MREIGSRGGRQNCSPSLSLLGPSCYHTLKVWLRMKPSSYRYVRGGVMDLWWQLLIPYLICFTFFFSCFTFKFVWIPFLPLVMQKGLRSIYVWGFHVWLYLRKDFFHSFSLTKYKFGNHWSHPMSLLTEEVTEGKHSIIFPMLRSKYMAELVPEGKVHICFIPHGIRSCLSHWCTW